MAVDPITETTRLHRVLLKGRMVEREAAQRRILARDPAIDRALLRQLLMRSLESDFGAEVGRDDKSDKAWCRCWLLSSLGRVADGDDKILDYLRRQLEPGVDPNRWARYWTLESLVVAQADGLAALAATVAGGDTDSLVLALANALLASFGDAARSQKLLEQLSGGSRWEALRALRVVPIEATVERLCEIVGEKTITDDTYDAIVALGALPPDWSCAETACYALIERVRLSRRHPWWDALRARALGSLGSLRCPAASATLIDELRDSNPAVVYEAARGLEQVLGTPRAVARIVEAAAAAGLEGMDQYASAMRWMNRDAVAVCLEELMASGADSQEQMARTLLREIGGRAAFNKLQTRADSARQHLEMMEAAEKGIRSTFDSALEEARGGFKLATAMDTVVFSLGVSLVIFSAAMIWTGRDTVATFTGSGGALGVIYSLFFSNPRRRVQVAVERLMTLKIIFLGYLRQLHQADQAFVRRYLDEKELDPATVVAFSNLIAETMRAAVLEIREAGRSAPTGKAAAVAAARPPATGGAAAVAPVITRSS